MSWDFKTNPELPNSQMEFYYWDSPHKQIFEGFRAKVKRVHDGDTITLTWKERNFDFPLRFLGIDAPELNAGGQEAGNWLRSQIEGEEVDIQIDAKNRVGKFGRILGRVMHRGLDLGDTMLRMGLVTTFENRRQDQIPNINQMIRSPF